MPVRVALNVVYALLVEHLEGDDRDEFEARLNGWDRRDQQANMNFQRAMRSGGED